MTGIIYKYTSPSGKSYIGQTTNEEDRKNHCIVLPLFRPLDQPFTYMKAF